MDTGLDKQVRQLYEEVSVMRTQINALETQMHNLKPHKTRVKHKQFVDTIAQQIIKLMETYPPEGGWVAVKVLRECDAEYLGGGARTRMLAINKLVTDGMLELTSSRQGPGRPSHMVRLVFTTGGYDNV